MRFTQSWLAMGALIVTLSLPGLSRAGSLEDRVSRLEQILENQVTTEILEKLEALQQENRELRGALEKQEHALKCLSEQQNYKVIASKVEDINLTKTTSFDLENNAYKYAYELFEKKNYIQAEAAFKNFLLQYPESKYIANAHYWLAEMYFSQWQINKDNKLLLEQAIAAFKLVTDKYQAHHKAADALLQLGVLEAEQGNWVAAKLCFESLKNKYPNSSRVRIADNKIQELKKYGHI